jgi:hypothetical protein
MSKNLFKQPIQSRLVAAVVKVGGQLGAGTGMLLDQGIFGQEPIQKGNKNYNNNDEGVF